MRTLAATPPRRVRKRTRKLMQKFRTFYPLLYKMSAAFAASWECEVEEPYSLALVLFTQACHDYDRSIPFEKYVACRVRWGLIREGKIRRRLPTVRLSPEVDVPDDTREFDLLSFIEGLSEDGRAIVSAALRDIGILPGTGGVQGGYRGRTRGVQGGRPPAPVSKERLEDIMAAKGWSRDRTRAAVKQVREALR